MESEALEKLFSSFELDGYDGEDPASKFAVLENALNESDISPPTVVKMIDGLLGTLHSSEHRLDYDDMVIEGTWRRDLDLMIYRDHISFRLIELREMYINEHITDPYLNSAPEEYLNFLDLLRCDIESVCRGSNYDPSPEKVSSIRNMLSRMVKLVVYGSRLLSIDTIISVSHFRKITYRAREKLEPFITKCTLGNPLPDLVGSFNSFSEAVGSLMADTGLDTIQTERNQRYMERKKWVYEYVLGCVQKLNGELEVCDPLDITQRKYLKDLVNTSHDYLRELEKDH
ncbi:MAG: hypothetical protein MJZ68_05475 [archaeon]|nr:hypothetical protein [archaeon]